MFARCGRVLSRRQPHVVLGVGYHASWEEVKAAFQRLAKQHHPDTAPGAARDAAATDRFKAVLEAYTVLKRQKTAAKQWQHSGVRGNGGPAAAATAAATHPQHRSSDATTEELQRWADNVRPAGPPRDEPEAVREPTEGEKARMAQWERLAKAVNGWKQGQRAQREAPEAAPGAGARGAAPKSAKTTPRRGWGSAAKTSPGGATQAPRTPNRGWRVRSPPSHGAADDAGVKQAPRGGSDTRTEPRAAPGTACILCSKTLMVPVWIKCPGAKAAADKGEPTYASLTAADDAVEGGGPTGPACLHCARDALGLNGVIAQRKLPALPRPLPPPHESSYTIDDALAARLDEEVGHVACIRNCGWHGPRAEYVEHIKRCGVQIAYHKSTGNPRR
eukprot:TRINITY_DN14895_c0_g1_i1.p2 TRINITY_DN14895_c0_g1~~TRINITY_DN14895_c0_g1_i1.p2  ORF type:complete len:389 (+),score=96.21 TRINITY_DN14895_c0_g1_i1:84-1250(+)